MHPFRHLDSSVRACDVCATSHVGSSTTANNCNADPQSEIVARVDGTSRECRGKNESRRDSRRRHSSNSSSNSNITSNSTSSSWVFVLLLLSGGTGNRKVLRPTNQRYRSSVQGVFVLYAREPPLPSQLPPQPPPTTTNVFHSEGVARSAVGCLAAHGWVFLLYCHAVSWRFVSCRVVWQALAADPIGGAGWCPPLSHVYVFGAWPA